MVITTLSYADSNSRPCGWISGYLYEKAVIEGKPYASIYDAYWDGYNCWETVKNSGKGDFTDKGLNILGLAQGGGTSPENGQRASSDLLIAHPNMDVLWVEMDSMALGALQELRQHNMVPGPDIKVVTCADGTRESLELIKAGTIMATATNIPYYNGKGIIDLIHKIFEQGYDGNNLTSTSFTPTECVNAQNVDKFYDPNDPFAKVGAWEPITIEEYNAQHAND
jgi:ribose transport system substrate-binding protein